MVVVTRLWNRLKTVFRSRVPMMIISTISTRP